MKNIAGELSLPKALPRQADGVRLGLFQPNVDHAFFTTDVEGVTEPTYAANREVAMLADKLGLSFLLTVARWKGVPGDTVGYSQWGLDTFTLAAALLEATERVTVFTTCHALVYNPAIVAKFGADLDHIGGGRWGLNIVAGWSEEEFGSLGIQLLPHDQRYTHAREWLAAVRELWTNGSSSRQCEYFSLNGAECRPRPLQQGGPVVVNAGRSEAGMRFAVENADYMFSASASADEFKMIRDQLQSHVGYIGRKRVLVRETTTEAEDVANEIVQRADRRALTRGGQTGAMGLDDAALREKMLEGAVIGSPSKVARELAIWCRDTSVDGICLTLFDYERELALLGGDGFELLGNELAGFGKSLVLTT